jgi:CheY-like chemotaxis protein
MNSTPLNILLADDDTEDCAFFKKALEELSLSTDLTTVHDGQQLMDHLSGNYEKLPDVIFLDLSMPCKSGFECLSEIKENERLKGICVIMFSSSFQRGIDFERGFVNMLYKIGAYDYINKTHNLEKFKEVLHKALVMAKEKISLKENIL